MARAREVAWRRGQRDAREQHREDASEKHAVEYPHRRSTPQGAEPIDLVEIEQIGADEAYRDCHDIGSGAALA